MLSPALWQRTSLSPFDGLFDFGVGSGFNRLWNRAAAFPASTGAVTGGNVSAWIPACDVVETGDAIQIEVELPGLNPDDIDVTVQNNVLTVSGRKSYAFGDAEGEGYTFHRRERGYGQFERSFTLPTTVLADELTADYSDGLLTLTLPKTEEAQARRVQINAGSSNGRSLGSGS